MKFAAIASVTALGLLMGIGSASASDPVSMSGAANAPAVMTDEQMDSVVAGADFPFDVLTRSGNVVWTVTGDDPLTGHNNGGHGNTEAAANGLRRAVDLGALLCPGCD